MKRFFSCIICVIFVLSVITPPLNAAAFYDFGSELSAANDIFSQTGYTKSTASIKVSQSFDFDTCFKYLRMLYADYVSIRWTRDFSGNHISLTV